MQKIAIIIPCYNEENRLRESDILALISSTSATIFLANDGSNDGTLNLIQNISSSYPERVVVLDYKQNQGKAATIYKAVNQISKENSFDFISYFDADFSTPPSEIKRLLSEIEDLKYSFLIGSRILLLNSGIQRKFYRHIIGRVIITLINTRFKLGIYDTQCGAKIFSSQIVKEVFDKPFLTSWLFDVEIFIRMKKKDLLKTGREIPIYNWVDVDGSKLGFKSGFKIIKELFVLHTKY
ncbi:glycosyltransferase [Flavobacterium sp. UBA6135]|uniref:glycosyltransferase n=1 Tax=Flavobacterium sp. UBA6135 TaxID=1946553 RepID=UPI0025BD229A|nr:glycosyltransferase [Flavobacterium sp. UBA6135]